VLELREPTPSDWAGRITQINLTIQAQMPVVDQVQIQASKVAAGTDSSMLAALQHLTLTQGATSPRLLFDVLTDGELGALGSPRPPHPVRRTFSPPAALHHEGQWVADVAVVDAIVGDASAPPLTVVVGGTEDVAYVIRDALSGARLWLTEDGRVWTTGD
jgi:hypothetical protein